MKTKNIKIKNKDGVMISAKLDLPIDSRPKSFAIFAHCFTCSKNLKAVANISNSLNRKGFGVLRFDFTGLGESEGDFSNTNFSSNIDDLIVVANWLKEKHEVPTLMIGHSLGGAAAIFAANKINSIQAVATIGTPSSPDHIKHLFKSEIENIRNEGEVKLSLAGREFTIKKQFIEDIESKNMKKVLNDLQKPILILHSPDDKIVEVENASTIYSYSYHPKSFISLQGADHLLSNEKDSTYVGSVISEWSERYIESQNSKELKTDKSVVARISEEGFTTDLRAGKHFFTADEPESVGGNEFGPNPYEYLMSSLGGCTAMTMRMYADRKNLKVRNIEVHLSHKKDYADDSESCNQNGKYIDIIEREIFIDSDLNKSEIQKLLEIADKCPVHKTLQNKVEINTLLKN